MFWCGCVECDSTFPIESAIEVYQATNGPFLEPAVTITCPKCGTQQEFQCTDTERNNNGEDI